MTTDAKRKLVLKLRRRVRIQSRFDCEDLGDGREKQTCRECGHAEVLDHAKRGANVALASKLIAYRAKGGVTGICKQCSKRAAIERYPL